MTRTYFCVVMKFRNRKSSSVCLIRAQLIQGFYITRYSEGVLQGPFNIQSYAVNIFLISSDSTTFIRNIFMFVKYLARYVLRIVTRKDNAVKTVAVFRQNRLFRRAIVWLGRLRKKKSVLWSVLRMLHCIVLRLITSVRSCVGARYQRSFRFPYYNTYILRQTSV